MASRRMAISPEKWMGIAYERERPNEREKAHEGVNHSWATPNPSASGPVIARDAARGIPHGRGVTRRPDWGWIPPGCGGVGSVRSCIRTEIADVRVHIRRHGGLCIVVRIARHGG